MSLETSSTSLPSAIALDDEDAAVLRACDLQVNILEPCNPQDYRAAYNVQIAEIGRQKRARQHAKDPKLHKSKYMEETSLEHAKYEQWTTLQNELDVEFWRFVSSIFYETVPAGWDNFFLWFDQKLNGPVTNVTAVQQMLDMAEELAFATILYATSDYYQVYLLKENQESKTSESVSGKISVDIRDN